MLMNIIVCQGKCGNPPSPQSPKSTCDDIVLNYIDAIYLIYYIYFQLSNPKPKYALHLTEHLGNQQVQRQHNFQDASQKLRRSVLCKAGMKRSANSGTANSVWEA